MTDDLTGLLSKGIDHLAEGRTVEEYMGQVDTTSLSNAEREELHELLDTSASLLPLRQLAVPPTRSKAANRARLLSEAVRQRETGRRQAALGGLGVPAKLRRGLLGVVLSLALLLVVGSGAVSAAAGSLPGSPLYPLKLAVEDARLTLAFSPPARTQLYMRFASERTAEMVRLATAGRPVSETVVARMAQHLQGALHAAEAVGGQVQHELLQQVIETSNAQREILTRASTEAPPETQAMLDAGAAVAEEASRQAQEALQNLLPPAITPTPAWTNTSTPVPSEPPVVAPADSPTPIASHTVASPTPSDTLRSPTPRPTYIGTPSLTPTVTPQPPTTPGQKPTHTPRPTRTPSATPIPVTPKPSDTPEPTHTPQAAFYLTNEDNPDPVPATYRIHYVICAVNDGEVPLTNVVITAKWSPLECVYLPPDNPTEISWDIGRVEPYSRRCVLFALSTYSICGGRTVANRASMTCDQGSAHAVQYTRIVGTPTPSVTTTITATVTSTLTVTPTGTPAPTVTLTPTGTLTPTVTLTPTGTPTLTVTLTPTGTLTSTLTLTPSNGCVTQLTAETASRSTFAALRFTQDAHL